MDRFFFLSGAIAAFIAVALGAFGAHSLRTKLSPDMLNIFEVGVRYQMYHALGLIAVAWAMTRWPEANLNAAGWAFIVGIVVFSGSLYLLSITDVRWLGAAVLLVFIDRALMAWRWIDLLCALTPGSRPPFASAWRLR